MILLDQTEALSAENRKIFSYHSFSAKSRIEDKAQGSQDEVKLWSALSERSIVKRNKLVPRLIRSGIPCGFSVRRTVSIGLNS